MIAERCKDALEVMGRLRSHGQVEDMNSKSRVCPVCMGTGKIVIGYEAICTEPVEKVRRCPACDGEGSLQIDEE